MAERDRTARYANPPRSAKAHGGATAGAEQPAEAAKPAQHAEDAGKTGADSGPQPGEDATWGVVAERHGREHADMLKRHGDEHAAMVERHHTEAKAMHKRHHEEARQHMEEHAAAAMRGDKHGRAPEAVRAESEGKTGSNP